MGTASLPMYDLPELREATDAWWHGITEALRAEGVHGVADELRRDLPAKEHWRSDELLLSQSCGYPLTHEFSRVLQPIGTPCYAVAGCAGPTYSSVIVLRAESEVASLAELRGSTAAFNSEDSHSGYNCLRAMIAPLAHGKSFFSEVVATGGHASSIAFVASGRADVAAVDCVTYALLERHRPEILQGTRKLGFTMPAPALPYVTRAAAPPSLVAGMRDALAAAAVAPDLQSARAALLIGGIAFLSRADYAPIHDLEQSAIDLGFPELR